MSGFDKGVWRMALMAASLCAASGVNAQAAAEPSVSGTYLSAIVSARNNDVSHAAEYFSDLVEGGQITEGPMLARAFIWMVADGRLNEVQGLAQRLMGQDPPLRDAMPYLVRAVYLYDRREYSALRRLTAPSAGEFGQLMLSSLKIASLLEADDKAAATQALVDFTAAEGLRMMREFQAVLFEESMGFTRIAFTRLEALNRASEGHNILIDAARVRLLWRMGDLTQARSAVSEALGRFSGNLMLQSFADALAAPNPAPPPPLTAREAVAQLPFLFATLLPKEQAGAVVDVYLKLALTLDPNFGLARFYLGNIREERGQYDEAIHIYQQIGERDLYQNVSRDRMAWAFHRLDRMQEAEIILREEARRRPQDSSPYATLGDIFRARKEFERAVETYSAAIDRIPNPQRRDWQVFFARGIAYERAKNWPKAEADLKRALELKPDDPAVLNYLGYSWVEQGVNIPEGLALIEKAVAQEPDDGHIVDSLGWAFYMLGRYEDAVRELERAVELAPEESVINDHLGDAYWRVGRFREARFQWERALSFNPEPQEREKIERKLRDGLTPP